VVGLGDRWRWRHGWRGSEEKEERKEEEEESFRRSVMTQRVPASMVPRCVPRAPASVAPIVHHGVAELQCAHPRAPSVLAPSYPPMMSATLAPYRCAQIWNKFSQGSICEKSFP
jgi:hypothetical protein